MATTLQITTTPPLTGAAFVAALNTALSNVVSGPVSSIASAATVDLGSVSDINVIVTGSATISSFGSHANLLANQLKWIRFSGTLTITHNATSMISPTGASLSILPNDLVIAMYLGSGNWRILARIQAVPAAAGGGGAWSNTRLAKTAAYTVVNADKAKTIALAGGAFYALTFSAASGYDADFNVMVLNEDTTRAKDVLISGGTNFRLYPGQSAFVFNQNNVWIINREKRWKLLGPVSIFVDDTNGNNVNDGLATGSGNAVKTIQKAYDLAAADFDFGAQTVTISIADGTYTTGLTVAAPWVGGGALTVAGNVGTPANVLINVSAQPCFFFTCPLPGTVALKDMKLQTTTSGNAIHLKAAGLVQFQNLNFGACAGEQMFAETGGAQIFCTGNYTISGGAGGAHMFTGGTGAVIYVEAKTVTLTGTPNFGNSFARVATLSGIIADGNTYSGAATGSRYSANFAGLIYTAGGANYFPGNAAGSVANGGQYI